MTTQELHIELDLLLQKVNNHWNQSFLPAEKDLFLNREITRYLNRVISRLNNRDQVGAFDTTKRSVELSPLVKTVKCPVIYSKNQREVNVLLPFDFFGYISSEIAVCCDCKNEEIKKTKYYKAELSPIKDLSGLPITVTQGLYQFVINPSDIPTDYLIESSIPMYSNMMMVTNALSILFKQKNNLELDVTYDTVKNKFVFRSYKHFTLSYKSASGQQGVFVDSTEFEYYPQTQNEDMVNVSIVDEEFKNIVKDSYLSGASPSKVLGGFKNGMINLTLKGVIAKYVNLTYFCKPNKIDLLLHSNSELNEETLENIVGDTAQRIMGVLGTDNYEKFVRENTLIE